MKIRGMSRLERKLRALPALVEREIVDAVASSALLIQNDMRRSLQKGPKTGRVYRRGKGGRGHRASAPGQAPATDSGRLVGSINFALSGRGLRASIGSRSIVYAARMEFGGVDKRGINIAARPFIRPALTRNARAVILKMRKAYIAGSRRIARGR